MTIPTISTLPTAPARTDPPATFVTRADSFLAALVVMQGELNTSIGAMNTDIAGVEANAISAAADAAAAAASASAAESASNATLWVSGQSYVQGDVVYSPIDFYSYRAKGATSGTTDPSLDAANWQSLVFNLPAQTGNTGKVLTTDGTTASWQTPSLDRGYYSAAFDKYQEYTFNLTSDLNVPAVVSVTKQVPQVDVIEDATKFLTDETLFTQLNPFEGEDFVIAPQTINNSSYTNESPITPLSYDEACCFSNDGSFLYICYSNQYIYKYPLTTVYDIGTTQSSAGYSGALGGQYRGFFYHPSEDIMYLVNNTGDLVEEFNPISMSKTGNSFYVGTQTTNPKGISFSIDGTKMYVGDTGFEIIYQYSLSTAWDITTATYDSVSLNCSTQDSDISDFHFLASGKTIYVAGSSNLSIFQYTLGTAWDLSTASFTQSYNVTQLIGGTFLLLIPPIPSHYYVAKDGTQLNYKYNLPLNGTFDTAYSNATVGGVVETTNGLQALVTNSSGVLQIDSQPTNLQDLTITDYEYKRVDTSIGVVRSKFNIVNPFQFTANQVTTENLQYNVRGAYVSPDTRHLMYYVNNTGVYSAKRTDTGGYINGFGTKTLKFALGGALGYMYMSKNGRYAFFVGDNSNSLYRYELNVPWDWSYGVNEDGYQEKFDLLNQSWSICFTADGLYAFVVYNSSKNYLARYQLSVPYDISTMVLLGGNSGLVSYTRGIDVDDNGTRLIIANESGSYVYTYYNGGAPLYEWTGSWNTVFDFNHNLGYNTSSIQYAVNGAYWLVQDSQTTTYPLRQFRAADSVFGPNNYGIPYVNKVGMDTTYWQSITIEIENAAQSTSSEVCFATSVDGRTTWFILSGTTVHNIARNNAGTWQYNSNTTLGSETWVDAPLNHEESALAAAISLNTTNDNWTINTVADSNWDYFSNNVLANSLDIAVINDPSSSLESTPPGSHGDIIITFTANTKEQGALIGIDYDFDQPASDKVRFSALESGTYKIRVL